MKRQHLLAAGLILVAASILGPAVQGSAGGWPWRVGQHMDETGHRGGNGHMGAFGHMSSGNNTSGASSQIEGSRDIVVTSTEFGFSPNEITATAEESVNFVLVNQGSVTHDLSIPELGVRIVANPDERATAGVSLDTPGTYRFSCSIPGHAAAGMIGTLKVTG